MVRKMPKLLANIMVISMVFTLVACSTASPVSSPIAATTATAADQTAKPAEPAATPDLSPVTLKYWPAYDATGTSGIQDNLIMKELSRITGVTLDIGFNMKQENYNAMIASGDLPDVFTIWNKDLKNLIDGGHVIDMEPLLAAHGKDILLDKGKVQFGKMFLSNGQNKLYFIPTWGLGLDAKPVKTFDNGPGIGAYMRWDAYKAVGYPVWEGDLVNLLPILKQMQDAVSKTAEGKKVYALSPWLGDWGLWNFTIYYQGFDNTFAEAGGFVDIDVTNYAMKSQILDITSTLWKGAKFWNKANQLGILDPDSLMQKFDQAHDKARTGRVLMVPTNWSRPNGDLQKISGDMGMVSIKMPSDKKMEGTLFSNPYTDRWSQAITTKCKTPERAMDLINFLNSDDGMRLFLNGVEGVHWSVGSDGVPHLLPDTLEILSGLKQSDDPKYAGFGTYSHLYGYAELSWDAKYNCPAQFIYNESPAKKMTAAGPYLVDYIKNYNVEYPDQLFEKTLPDQGKIFDGSFTQMVDQTPTEIKQIDDNLQNFLLVELVNIINSASDADFDAAQAKIIEECKNRSAEQAYDWHIKAYQAAISKVQTFYDSNK